jgi:hypothetical protein
MKYFSLYLLISALQTSSSLQSPVLYPPIEASSSKNVPPLHDLVVERPGRTTSKHGVAFAQEFARHPDIAALKDLPHDEYVRRAFELRNSFNHDLKAREKFRKALVHHMEEVQVVNPETLNSVKSRFSSASQKESNERNVIIQKQKDLTEFKLKKKLFDAQRRQRLLQAGSKELIPTFAQRLQMMGIKGDADAYTIEETSRGFDYESKGKATAQLRKYLEEKNFSPDVIKTAISRRTWAARSVFFQGLRKGKNVVDKKRKSSDLSEESAHKRIKHHEEDSTSLQSTNKGLKSTPSIKLLDAKTNDILQGGNRFDETEWWNDI